VSDSTISPGSPARDLSRRELSRGLLPLVFLGLAMIACATLFLTWPSDVPGEPRPRLVPHWARLVGLPLADTPPVEALAGTPALTFDWAWRRIWDGLHYLLLLGGLGLATWAAFTERPWPWIGLAAVGALGVIYTAGVALYVGPMCAAPGYLLVLLPALLTTLTIPRTTPITPE